MTFSLIAVVAVNAAANIVPFNGSTTGEISNRLPILFTPCKLCIFNMVRDLSTCCRLAY